MREIFESQNWVATLLEKFLKLKETWPWIHWRRWLKCEGISNREEENLQWEDSKESKVGGRTLEKLIRNGNERPVK